MAKSSHRPYYTPVLMAKSLLDNRLMVAILAAGASRRLGRPKQLVCFGEEPLLRRQCRIAIEAQIGAVAAILGCQATACAQILTELPLLQIVNSQWQEGLGSSIRCAVAAAQAIEAQGLLLVHADQYRITAVDLRSLESAWLETPTAACIADYGDNIGPPVIFSQACFSTLLQLQGDVGARRVLTGLPSDSVRRIRMPNALHDLDSSFQLAELERIT